MYLTGKLEIDPSQSTTIKKVKENNFFKKFLDALTFGQISSRQEHETFTAVSILQQVYMGLHSIHIENMIRLAVDDYDFYLDESGVDNDLEKAMFEFSSRVDPIESELFNHIFLVLEHLKDSIKYLIEIRISRKHKVGEYPIVININGIFPEFKMGQKDTANILKNKIKTIFESQENYDKFLNEKWTLFNIFINELELAAKKFIKVDNIIKSTSVQIIRPKKTVNYTNDIMHDRFANPVYYGYFNFDNYFFYAWIWAGMMFDSNLYANNFYLVDDLGRPILMVGETGFNAGEFDSLNPGVPFVAPTVGDLQFYSDNEYEEDLYEANLIDSDDIDSDIGDIGLDSFDTDSN